MSRAELSEAPRHPSQPAPVGAPPSSVQAGASLRRAESYLLDTQLLFGSDQSACVDSEALVLVRDEAVLEDLSDAGEIMEYLIVWYPVVVKQHFIRWLFGY